MSERRETIADIIAEMKRRKEMLEDAAFNAPLCYSTETVQAQHEILDEFIERFETAHRRELARVDSVIDEAVHGYPPEDIDDNREIGNGAKLREALEEVLDDYQDDCAISRMIRAALAAPATTEKSSAVGNSAKLRDAIVHMIDTADSIAMREPTGAIGKLAFHIKHTGDAALSAPPRNCDKYATADEALKAQEQMFNDSNFANGECKLGCPECDNPRVGCKIAWLFAPATEQKGKSDGK